MIVKKAKKEDFEHYSKLEKEFYNYHKKYNTFLQDINPKKRNIKKEFYDLIKEQNFFRFVMEGNKTIGYIYGIIKKVEENEKNWRKKGELNSIIITKKYRKKGVAKKLVKEFFKWLKNKKIRYVETSCNIKNNTMIKFNKKIGFKEQHIKFGKLLKRHTDDKKN